MYVRVTAWELRRRTHLSEAGMLAHALLQPKDMDDQKAR